METNNNVSYTPNEIKEYFILSHINFEVSAFEEFMLNDVYRFDENAKEKLHRDITKEFTREVKMYIRQKRNFRASFSGKTRCNFKGTKILMADLTLKNIEECVLGDKILTINETTNKIEIKSILNIFNNGKKEVFELSLKGGKKILSTDNHPFYNYNLKTKSIEWKELKDLKKNDFIGTLNEFNNKELFIKTKYNLNEINLLGFWLGDGYMQKNNSKFGKNVVFDISKQDKINYLNSLVNKTKLNYKLNCHDNGYKNINWVKGYKFLFTKKIQYKGINNSNRYKDDFSQMIFNLKLENCLAHSKFIPIMFKLATIKELYALLSGLLSSDGSLDKTKGIIYCSVSIDLINDIEIILTKLGIDYTKENRISKFKGKEYPNFIIKICKFSEARKILKNCNLRNDFKNSLEVYLFKQKRKCSKSFIIQDDIKFKQIKDIKKIGILETYDLNVKDNHNYIANFIINHNSGKSLSALKIADLFLDENGKNLQDYINKVICGNQIQYRQKLQDAEFGDFLLVDENFVSHSGMGSNIEMQQLKDYNNIIAKKNISAIFLTPDRFLNINATIGFKTFGRDSNNWLSKILVYNMEDNMPFLVGYIIIDIGSLFRKYGCYVYKTIGGCTNNFKKKVADIPQILINHSTCISNTLDITTIKDDTQTCPFYNLCKHPLCTYEHIKDSWIEDTMTGALDERTAERYKLSILMINDLFKEVTEDDEELVIKLKAKNKADLKNRIKLLIVNHTNMKMGIMEFNEFVEIVLSNCNVNMLITTLQQLDKRSLNDIIFNMDRTGAIEKLFNKKSKISKEEKKI